MTRTGPAKQAPVGFADGRLVLARVYRKAAHDAVTLLRPGDFGSPAMSHMVMAAIAYTDALTAAFAGKVNQKDHAAAVRALRDAIGNRLPKAREADLRNILSKKDDVQYGIGMHTAESAQSLLARLEDFANWAEQEFARPR